MRYVITHMENGGWIAELQERVGRKWSISARASGFSAEQALTRLSGWLGPEILDIRQKMQAATRGS